MDTKELRRPSDGLDTDNKPDNSAIARGQLVLLFRYPTLNITSSLRLHLNQPCSSLVQIASDELSSASGRDVVIVDRRFDIWGMLMRSVRVVPAFGMLALIHFSNLRKKPCA
jgi:hypothetical protein